jgi:hypothetical protein
MPQLVSASVSSTAAAVTFAAGIALAGLGLQAPTEMRARRDAESGRSGARRTEAPTVPTLANAQFVRALTATGFSG